MTTPHMTNDEVERLVRVAAARYCRRAWWADADELTQEGRLAAWQALKSFDPSVGVEPVQYVWRAILFAMRRALWRDSAPVSGGGHRPEQSYAGLTRAPVDDLLPFAAATPPADALVDEATWHVRVRERLHELADGEHGGRIALRMLLEECTASELAKRTGKPVAVFHNVTARLRARIASDASLYDLARELRKS